MCTLQEHLGWGLPAPLDRPSTSPNPHCPGSSSAIDRALPSPGHKTSHRPCMRRIALRNLSSTAHALVRVALDPSLAISIDPDPPRSILLSLGEDGLRPWFDRGVPAACSRHDPSRSVRTLFQTDANRSKKGARRSTPRAHTSASIRDGEATHARESQEGTGGSGEGGGRKSR